MEWDLVIRRNMQLFIRLAGLTAYPLATQMQWQQAHYQTHLGYRHGRVSLSQLFPHSPFDRERLLTLLRRWEPASFCGIPQRLCQVRKGRVISCSMPCGTLAELWLQLHRRQIAFMEPQ